MDRSHLTSIISTESDTDENKTKEELVDRRERNRRRKKRNSENKKNLKAEVSLKASMTLGLQPIRKEEIEALKVSSGGDEKVAREKAVRNYLENYLQFNEEELSKVTINDTKIAASGDNTVYVVFNEI